MSPPQHVRVQDGGLRVETRESTVFVQSVPSQVVEAVAYRGDDTIATGIGDTVWAAIQGLRDQLRRMEERGERARALRSLMDGAGSLPAREDGARGAS